VNARAIATRWRSPPDNCRGKCFHRASSPTASSCNTFARWDARETQRNLEVLARGQHRQQVERLKDKTDFTTAQASAFAVAQSC